MECFIRLRNGLALLTREQKGFKRKSREVYDYLQVLWVMISRIAYVV